MTAPRETEGPYIEVVTGDLKLAIPVHRIVRVSLRLAQNGRAARLVIETEGKPDSTIEGTGAEDAYAAVKKMWSPS